MSSVTSVVLLPGLIAAILLMIEVGRQIGLRRRRSGGQARGASSTIEASIFGFTGLFIAFIFYGAASRFDSRRSLVVQEANAMRTAYLRLNLLPAAAQHEVQSDFREYVQSRLAVQQIRDVDALWPALARSAELQRKLWKASVEAAKEADPAYRPMILTPLNDMIDITVLRTLALTTHPPAAVFAVLFLTIIVCSLLAGHSTSGSESREWMSMIIFALVWSAVVYVIIDYEFPRVGLIRLDPVDQFMAEILEK